MIKEFSKIGKNLLDMKWYCPSIARGSGSKSLLCHLLAPNGRLMDPMDIMMNISPKCGIHLLMPVLRSKGICVKKRPGMPNVKKLGTFQPLKAQPLMRHPLTRMTVELHSFYIKRVNSWSPSSHHSHAIGITSTSTLKHL
ncbi:hypothetical protein [La Joya virus]|uniref:Uncharacterized protein n=1 Tax=La Joya virus TaxID=1272946 RepID=A0A0D3R140_9RHAB|nr:hypothetical protein [La Joya virus]AJR28306.1 hypothetical protein [La Joya virus]